MKSLRASAAALLLGAWVSLGLVGAAAGQTAQGTAFTYQGVLRDTGLPASGEFDLRFRLFGAATAGTQVGSTICRDNVSVNQGLFDVSLDFGATAFTGSARWLEISVRAGGAPGNCTTGTYTTLTTRQALTPAPGAIFSNLAGGAVGTFTILEGSPARVSFGSTGLCTLGIDSTGPTGVLLRDPVGIRVIPPTATPVPSRLLFGPTDNCTIGIDPTLPGLILRDPRGGRLINPIPTNPTRLLFGPTEDCTVGIDPSLPGLILRDPRGPRLINPEPTSPTRLLFGPTDNCTVGIDPGLTGLILRDPSGPRLINPLANQPTRLLFGPTNDCRIAIDPALTGLILYDPRGVRICVPNLPVTVPTRLLFGPTDDCTIGIDPVRTGLILRDPSGVRIDPPPTPVPQPARLLFGPTDLCTVGIDPFRSGLILRDPRGIRIDPPNPGDPPIIMFGPSDLCTVGTNPQIPGLILTDPRGIRLINPEPSGLPRLIFGPTDDCAIGLSFFDVFTSIEISDPLGVRIRNPRPDRPPTIFLGDTLDCSISVNPPSTGRPGMIFTDPRGYQFNGGFTGMGITQPAEFRLQLPTTANTGGQALANRWIDASSRRWKENIRPIDDAVEKLSRLKGVYFDWKKDHGGSSGLGFIAEEVGEVFPQVVAWEPNGKDASGVSYDHLVAVTVEAIKSQQTEITTLKAENADLKARLERIEKLLQIGQ